MRLIDILNEMKFGVGGDQDSPSGSRIVIVFDPDDKYIRVGQTHGLISHAIKHLSEIRPDIMSRAVSLVSNKILSSKYIVKNLKGDVLDGLPPNHNMVKIAINTMDRVNDKVMNNEPLTNEEKYIYKVISAMSKPYQQRIQDLISKSENVDDIQTAKDFIETIKNTKQINFSGKYRDFKIRYYLDLNDGFSAFVMDNDTIKSAFVLYDKQSKSMSLTQRLKHYFSSDIREIDNPVLSKILGSTNNGE